MKKECCWQEYYELSKQIYQSVGEKIDNKIALYDLTVSEHNDEDSIITVENAQFRSIISKLADEVDNLFKNPENYTLRAHALGLNDVWQCKDTLQALGDYLVPQLQQRVFKSYVHVDNIKIYRSEKSDKPDTSSWLWHFDNNPQEQVKILIYLTDVGAGDGEFTFLKKGDAGIKVPTSRVSYPKKWIEPWNNPPPVYRLSEQNISWLGRDRVPVDAVNKLKNVYGYEINSVKGKKGTLFLFDNNIIHKATVPKNNHRDVIVMQFKPSIEEIKPYINPKNTGNGWQHTTFNKDPAILQVVEANH